MTAEPWYPVPPDEPYAPAVTETCGCGHDEGDHDGDGLCLIRGCSCDGFVVAEDDR